MNGIFASKLCLSIRIFTLISLCFYVIVFSYAGPLPQVELHDPNINRLHKD